MGCLVGRAWIFFCGDVQLELLWILFATRLFDCGC